MSDRHRYFTADLLTGAIREELPLKPQPSGQRASDLAEWVVEHYPELVEAAQAKRAQLQLGV